MPQPTVVVLFGAKATGKTALAHLLQQRAGVHHVDADTLVLQLLLRRQRPHPTMGWLLQVEQEVRAALEHHQRVSVEATGAWESDWRLPERLSADGVAVIRVHVRADLEITLARLRAGRRGRVEVTLEEARWIYRQAERRAAVASFDSTIDTSEGTSSNALERLVRQIDVTSRGRAAT